MNIVIDSQGVVLMWSERGMPEPPEGGAVVELTPLQAADFHGAANQAGLMFDGEEFSPMPVPEPPPPSEVSPLQIRRALRLLGQQQERDIIGQVNAYVATLPDEDQEAWEYAVAIPIDDPRIVTACMLLQLDRPALFRLAGSLA